MWKTIPKTPVGITAIKINRYKTLLSLHFRDFSLRENIGISLTNAKDSAKEIIGSDHEWTSAILKAGECPQAKATVELQSRAHAGVGSPKNEWLCLVSKLNLANLIAENGAIRSGMQRTMWGKCEGDR